jgi:hypothetical protein
MPRSVCARICASFLAIMTTDIGCIVWVKGI